MEITHSGQNSCSKLSPASSEPQRLVLVLEAQHGWWLFLFPALSTDTSLDGEATIDLAGAPVLGGFHFFLLAQTSASPQSPWSLKEACEALSNIALTDHSYKSNVQGRSRPCFLKETHSNKATF